MSEGPSEKSSPGAPGAGRPARKRHRGRRVLLILLALLLVFHRPLLIALVHAIAIEVAAKQNIHLSLGIEGTIFTNISLKNIRAVPNGKGPTPVENISIEEVTVNYSIPSLVRKGFSEFLTSYVLRNAYIVVKPVEGTTEQKSDLASTLHGLIQQPALFSNHVGIDNLNLVAHVPDGEFAVKNLTLLLDPVQPGELDIGLLEIPKVRTWQNLKATATYANRDMILRGLEIDPQIVIQKFELDASRRAEGINRLDVQGALFGGAADFSLLVRQLPGKHRNNASNAQAQINSSVHDISLEKVSQYFHAGTPAIGSVTEAGVNLTGDPNTPSSWTGSITTEVGEVRAGSAIMDKATLRLDVTNGWATLGATLFSGSNSVTVQGDGKLPESLDGFAGTAITGWLNISGNDLHHLAGGVTSGSLTGDGTFDLRDNTLRAGIEVKASNVYTNAAANDLFVSDADVKAQVTKRLPGGEQSGTAAAAAPFDGLQTQLDARVSAIQAGAYAIDSADVGVSTRDALVRIENVDVRRAGNALSASGTYTMPRDMTSWATAPANLDFSLNAPSIVAFNAEPNLNALNGNLQAGGSLSNGPEGYSGNITANLSDLHMQDFAANGLKLNVSIAKSVATIDTLTFSLNQTDGLSATGHVALSQPYAYDGTVQAQIRDLSKFNTLVSTLGASPKAPRDRQSPDSPLAGALTLDWRGRGDLSTLRSTGELDFALKNGKFQTIQAINAAIDGSYSPEQLQFPIFTITSSLGNFSAVIAAQNDLLRVDQILVQQANRPLLSGSLAIPLDLRTPAKPETLIPANGPISADLVSTNVALESFFPKGQAPASGTAKVSIAARGSIDQPNVQVTVAGRNLKAKAAGVLPPMSLDTAITLLGRQLTLTTRVAPGSGGVPLLSGSAAIPLDLRTPTKPDTLVPTIGPISANLTTGDLALESFFPKGHAPAIGWGKVTITASGSIDQPNATLTIAGRNLRAKAAATVPPATLDAAFALLGQQLSLKARLAMPSFSTVDIAGTIPMPLKEILRQQGKLDPQSPLQLSVRVPRGPLSVLTRIVPAIRFIQGTAEASVDVAGTVARPQLSGAALLDLPAVRLANPDMPSVNGFRGEVRFAGNRLTLGQFGGNLSGGRFDLTGGIVFADFTNPVIDLHFVSHGDLILRNEAVTVRADSDVRISGPLAGASVTGDIGITKSRFFKEIDILPLELPGRPAPPPPPAPATSPSIDVPPLSNWKFALKIHTKDPFIIQGNLANGAALIDLNLGGTGKAPTLDGTVRIENFVASLPFSKLRVTNGFVYFTKDDPFIPHLNIQAASTLQDYEVNVYIYGTAQDPKTVMSSEPPLRQQDIVSLLATGATTSSLNSGTGLAGRAAVLLAQSIYHKIFKAKPPTDNESFASRFKVDVGGVDPRTGQQEISSSFKLSGDLYLIGDIDVGGDLRGMVRYLLRFR